MSTETNIAPINEDLNVEKYKEENIKNLIYTIRGKQVMLDSDVAELYHYETKRINETVKRNIERFPEDFCFKLTLEEYNILKSQIATSNIKKIRQLLYYLLIKKTVAYIFLYKLHSKS